MTDIRDEKHATADDPVPHSRTPDSIGGTLVTDDAIGSGSPSIKSGGVEEAVKADTLEPEHQQLSRKSKTIIVLSLCVSVPRGILRGCWVVERRAGAEPTE